MGRPFKKELSLLNNTYNWAKKIELNLSPDEIKELMSTPTFVVGSGGSFSACHMFSLLQQARGGFSKPITPLELHYSSDSIRSSNVVFLSASGKNSDILFAYKTAIKQDAASVLGICMKKKSKLFALSVNHSISKILEFDSPAGKDGFLATNSLIAYFTILSRIFGYNQEVESFGKYESIQEEIKKFSDKLDSNFTITVLYAGWGQPIAIDIESKFTEAGLGNVLVSDFRNFGHGRHNWFDKKKKQSAIIALVTPSERDLAQKTLSLLPDYIPKLILTSGHSYALASTDLLIQSFLVADSVGEKIGIDPGRPGVPVYGSKLYNLRYQSILSDKKDYKTINAILRKCGKTTFEELDKNEAKFWIDHLNRFREKITTTNFGCIVLDYDGTLCTKEERAKLPSAEIIKTLNSFIGRGFIIGIVTGRGKSIRDTLQACFDKTFWKNVIVGYYNGGVVACLSDSSQPDISAKPNKPLKKILELLKAQSFAGKTPDFTLRPLQLTIEKNNVSNWDWAKTFIKEQIALLELPNIQLLESGHSIDIIAKPEVSKINIFKYCIDKCKERGISERIVCIGDKGKYPGNDYQILASEFSLSVDEVSSDPESCWNISEIGQRGSSSCLHYLNSVKFAKSYFTLSL
jgi:fructoselysine-6-P-deglycase FrlB-like protein/hydroxymethylpyrimidine pyrophosphatase-like HAD family hydrolase